VNGEAPTSSVGATTRDETHDTSAVQPLFAWRQAIQDSDLPPTARHVALNLSTHMNLQGGSCFPSLETQAFETGLHKSTVARALKRLERCKYLYRSPGGGRTETGNYIPTHYWIRLSGEESHTTTVEPEELSQSARGSVAYESPTVAQDAVSSRTVRPKYFSSSSPDSSLTLNGSEQSQSATVRDSEQEKRHQEHRAGIHDKYSFADCFDCEQEASHAS
jgi:hypothetical protein